jgi:HSP20 family molecular chaperone IbpA
MTRPHLEVVISSQQGSSVDPFACLGNVLAEMNKEMNHFMSSFNFSPTGFSLVTPSFFDSLLFPEQLPRSPTSMLPHPHHLSLAVEEDDGTFMLSGQVEDDDKEDIKVTLEDGNILTIKGFHKTEEGDETMGTKARMSYSFVRCIQLAEGTDINKIEANMKDGLLKVMVPKPLAKSMKEIKLAEGWCNL